MHNRLVIALRKLACMQGNDEAIVYGERRDIDGHEVAGEPAWLMLRDKGDCPRCHTYRCWIRLRSMANATSALRTTFAQ